MTREKNIIYAARLVSLIFTPFYLPLVGLIVLFTFSYLNLLPVAYRLLVLTIVYVFTILLPTFIIHLYRRAQGWSLLELGQKRRRMVPYGISIICYVACLWTLDNMHIYHFVSSIVVAALLVQVICAIVNVWWKISTHTAGIGGMAGALFVFAEYFAFNPVWWLCVVLFVAGILGTARIILRQHSLAQVVAGFLIGFVCAAVGIIFF
ncbi:MAG: phosphatase PAP2 family protein [Prevotella sp.]|nr:phosphatase PAP2 family protein [Prevotella sp.]MDE6807749.1 phosphatase PAP2 family protein [Prevotella sp.]